MPNSTFSVRRNEYQQTPPHMPLPLNPLSELNECNYSPVPTAMSSTEYAGEADPQDAENGQDKPRLTIRQLRQAAQKEALAKELAKTVRTPDDDQFGTATMPKKKKASIFGGLFQVREPTQVALNQVAAQMIAQHGSTSATKVPNVRLEKMPEFVPKVNTRWDGIPDSVKQKEKEKTKLKLQDRRGSFFGPASKSESDDGRLYRHSLNSSSTTASSFGAYGNSSGSQGASSRTRFYAQSVNSSGDLASQQRTDTSQFSPPATSQPEGENLTEELTDTQRWLSADIQPPSRLRNEAGGTPPKPFTANRPPISRPVSMKPSATRPDAARPPKSSTLDRPLISPAGTTERTLSWESIDWRQAARSYNASRLRDVPPLPPLPTGVHQSSPLPSPSLCETSNLGKSAGRSFSHATSFPLSDSQASPAPRKKKSQVQVTDAFLAGEAQELTLSDGSRGSSRSGLPITPQQPGRRTADSAQARVQQDLEKRPDSSRDRLGLRASMLFTEETPWMRETTESLPPSPKIEQHTPNAKNKSPKPFGKFGK